MSICDRKDVAKPWIFYYVAASNDTSTVPPVFSLWLLGRDGESLRQAGGDHRG
jgi:hypothetical protein